MDRMRERGVGGVKKKKRQSWLGLNAEETGRRGEISAQDAGM